MSKITLGKSGGKNVTLDLDVLLSTRMLLTADSGEMLVPIALIAWFLWRRKS